VVGLVLSTVTTAAADRAADAPRPTGDQQTVTLVTGDRVTVVAGKPASVTPAAGREGMTFSVHSAQGHNYVVPADARQLVNSGRVDRRLFDISTLLEFGYDDHMPLIVTGDALPMAARSGRDLPSVNGVAVAADAAGALWGELTAGTRTQGVSKVWLDGKRKSLLDHSVPQIGAPAAWEAGYTGAGSTVAVLDTGVDQTHPDLADREIAEQNFSEAPDNVDHYGHGTHVASIVAGTGAKSGGKYRGVASGASILDGKVLDDSGSGAESWIIAGMEWAAEQGADVVNLSLGGGDLPGIDPMEEAVNTLSAEHGTLFVIAAGNSGADETIGTPGSAEAALTVGAVDREDQLADFSSRGPRTGDGGLKPDLTAPGVDIVAALHADGVISDPVEPGYTALSGTSMATPHVAGAAALLAQQHPDWTGAQLKAALTASATPNPDLGEYAQGAGRVDVARAIEQTVVSEPTNVSLGLQSWPHDDDEPVTKSFSYRNTGATDVTLALALDTDAAEGVFTLSADEITVPAGGTAEVSVTADTRVGTTDGALSGTVVATAGDTTVRTPIGVVREVESYNLTINYLDENGAPAPVNDTLVLGQSHSYFNFASAEDGSAELRLPKGRYLLDHLVITEGPHFNMVMQPNFELTEDTSVTVDARTTKPIEITPPDDATLLLGDIGMSLDSEYSFGSAFLVDDLTTISTAQLGPPPPAPDVLTGKVSTHWSGADGTFYGLPWFTPNEFPTGLTKTVDPADLATVQVDVGSQGADRTGIRAVFPTPVVGSAFAFGVGQSFPLPGGRTEQLLADGVRWSSLTSQANGEAEEVTYYSPLTDYRAGRTYEARVNHAMFGPSLPDDGFPGGWVYRADDTLIIEPPLFGDSAGNGGFSVTTSAVTKVYSGDELIAETPAARAIVDVPAGERDFRVTVDATRGAPFDLTTEVSAEWTFTSDTAAPGEVEPQDVSVLRFHPRLDAGYAAPAGRPFAVPVLLQRNGGDTERARGLRVEVSYDEGKTWQRAPVLLDTVAVLHHPANAETVSLRASARDRDGNTVKQTIIRAYHLK
jgi:subtilisin family serine protease